MGIPGSANPLLLATAAPTGYNIERCIRLNAADGAFLSRTPASAGNRKTWTWAGWVKRSGLGNFFCLESAGSNDNFGFSNADKFQFYFDSGVYRLSTQVFRDTSAWYHLVVVYDSPNATAQNRIRVYVNGSEITAWDTNATVTQNRDSTFNSTGQHAIGWNIPASGGQYFPGYLADIHFIDGQALDPTSFGEFDVNNVWQPKAYTGSYGTNGFQLKFADNSAATAAALGKDTSGNGHNWTPTNLSVTAGAGNDSLVDTPTNYGTDTGVGAEVRGNYCTWNPLKVSTNQTLLNGNLDTGGSSSALGAVGTIGVSSGKWYWELFISSGANTDMVVGITSASSQPTDGYAGSTSTNGWSWRQSGSLLKSTSNITGSISTSFLNGDILQFALDADSGKVWLGKNNTWLNSGNPGVGQQTITYATSEAPYFPNARAQGGLIVANFGQRPFAYTAPSGFKALCTANLPTPTITKPSTVMDVVTYTGTGSSLTPTSTLGFSPDLVWIKSRSAATDHTLYDAVRGAQARLESNNTDTEATSDNGLTAFNSNGFTLGTLAQVNTNAATYAAWTWDAGSSTVTNTSGTISSQVRANPSAGFSVVSYSGGPTNSTVGHGLGVPPGMIIAKSRTSGTGGWAVYHRSLGGGAFLALHTTEAQNTTVPTYWGTPNSSTFGISDSGFWNNNGSMVAYCFAPVAGYSAFGTYTGNGSADGPFVFCNFRPRWVMIKASSVSGTHWILIDSTRSNYNQTFNQLYANLANAEDVNNSALDLLSNGFKCRADTFNNINASGVTYIYAAFAEHPFSASRAR